jgi:hypothetical protein
MFTVELHEQTQLYLNGFRVVDLKKPFHRIVGRDEGVNGILRSPSESLSRQKKPLTYYVKFAEKKAGALFHSEVIGLKCHWIYNTNTSISQLFRDKGLLTLLNVLETDMEVYAEVRRYLSSILRLLWKSYPFDCVVTSLKHLPLLLPGVPVVVMPLMLISLPKQPAFPSVRYKTLQAVLKGHSGSIPLSLLTGESFRFLALRHTSFEKEKLHVCKNILILEGTNTSYAGFLARELSFLSGVKEVLPTTLFHIGAS